MSMYKPGHATAAILAAVTDYWCIDTYRCTSPKCTAECSKSHIKIHHKRGPCYFGFFPFVHVRIFAVLHSVVNVA